MDKELQEAKRKHMIRNLGKCGKCKFNNYIRGEKGNKFKHADYCHVKDTEIKKVFFCRDFKKNR